MSFTDTCNTPEILRSVWDTLADFSKDEDVLAPGTYFCVRGSGNKSLENIAFQKCKARKIVPHGVDRHEDAAFRHIVQKVYQSALNMGLVLPSCPNEPLHKEPESGSFHFTAEGIRHFSKEFFCLDDHEYLAEALKELKQRIDTIDDGQIKLLLEAQRCLKNHCYRAAMVVIGVANEDACLSLLCSIPLSIAMPSKSKELRGYWKQLTDETQLFGARWKPALRVLQAIKSQLRQAEKEQSWWQWWDMIPASLGTLGEAVRIARNSAVHNAEREFSRAEVALLLAAMPTQLEMLANITDFLKNEASILSGVVL